ncbi:gluconokinase [Kitasatospora sp. RG8]|uniref:gluconokinase n=1 Tax=Kitasatospora sp. RG8 TaxID=2820815 RepID=UPI001ADFA47D|nr:gluconokinase [Kitasatospora sp. RG8]MBP0454459.1 gluconokinase [Kitasatospora sp. RG8]
MALSVENHDTPGPTTPGPLTVVVMGVSGVGKTTVARLLADRLDLPYGEADDFHPPANIAKMSAGIPLDDEDRAPWLRALGGWLKERTEAGTGGVVTCSALKRRYRDTLREACPGAFFLHLSGGHGLVEDRLAHRAGHFMPPSLLASQYAALEPLAADERGAVLDVGPSPDQLVEMAVALLRPVNGDLA